MKKVKRRVLRGLIRKGFENKIIFPASFYPPHLKRISMNIRNEKKQIQKN